MRSNLRADDPELRDLCRDQPELTEAMTGVPTGLRLKSFVGGGGMSTVFLAELDPATRSNALSTTTPRELALKFLQPATYRYFKRMNQDPSNVFLREVVALSRMMERSPPTEFVVGYYGSGYADVELAGEVVRLPWLAIEYVDGGQLGGSLAERVLNEHMDGVDPVRALRLLRGIFSGVAALHDEGIVHRDLKPENVLITGPVDDETPKLADCGIARVDGMAATIAGMTPSYGGPEQLLSSPGQRNPLIGTWTDIHALAAVTWFILACEDWCRSDADPAWHAGERRSLRTSTALHKGFSAHPELVAKIDAVLARGAAKKLPEFVWALPGATAYRSAAKHLLQTSGPGPERYMSVEEFGSDLFPLLEACASQWRTKSAKENRMATAFRATQQLGAAASSSEPRAKVKAHGPVDRATPAEAGSVVFQADGRFLVRFGDRLDYFIQETAHRVKVPPEHEASVSSSRWMLRGPGGGFALVGPRHILTIRGGKFTSLVLPERASGGEVGEICAVVDDGRTFGIVTAETDDSDGSELWRSEDGTTWQEALAMPLGGDVRAVSSGPYGYVVVGARKLRARAMLLGFDNQPVLFTKGVNERTPLVACVCGAGKTAWAAGDGFVLSLERGAVNEEPVEAPGSAIAMGLDLVGAPWLLTSRAVLRRHVDGVNAKWCVYHKASDADPPYVALGFSPGGVRVVDARGGGVHVAPRDVRNWQSTQAR